VLNVGDDVLVQNQCGNHPLRWEKTGRIVERKDYNQYVVRMHGSGRCSLRNRRFLRRCLPFCTDSPSPSTTTIDPVATQPPKTIKQPTKTTAQPASTVSTEPRIPPPITTCEAAPSPNNKKVDHPATPDRSDIDLDKATVDQGIDNTRVDTTDDCTDSATSPVDYQDQSQAHPADGPQPLRRSTRLRRPRKDLSLTLTGQYHGYSSR
jgi:hypothetical protein